MRLAETAHTSHPWRIHELAPDFRLEDVWALPTPGAREDFPQLVKQFASSDPSRSLPGVARALWSFRIGLGDLLGWDDAAHPAVALRDRLPQDLREAPTGPSFDSLPFTSLYMLEDEWAGEAANRTLHGVLHLGWVRDPDCGYRGQMAVLVKPNGGLGTAYMTAIRPFRHLIVYPALMQQIARAWQRTRRSASPEGVSA